MKRSLCKPCACNLEVAFKVKKIPGISVKDTCQECGKRRFCSNYELTKIRTVQE